MVNKINKFYNFDAVINNKKDFIWEFTFDTIIDIRIQRLVNLNLFGFSIDKKLKHEK